MFGIRSSWQGLVAWSQLDTTARPHRGKEIWKEIVKNVTRCHLQRATSTGFSTWTSMPKIQVLAKLSVDPSNREKMYSGGFRRVELLSDKGA